MELTARARGKTTHKGWRDVIDSEITEGMVTPKGGGLDITLRTKPLALSGNFVAQLHLDWEEIELLAHMAAAVPASERLRLLAASIAEHEAEAERWRKKIPPTEGEE